MPECRECVISIGVKGIFFLCRILAKHSKRHFAYTVMLLSRCGKLVFVPVLDLYARLLNSES